MVDAPDPKAPDAPAAPAKLTDVQIMDKIFGADPAAKKHETPKDEKADDTPPKQSEVEETQEAEEQEDPELERAWAALERDGWRKSEIKKLGVATIKELGLKRARNHEDVDRAYADLKTWKAKAEAAEKPKTEANTDSVAVKDDLSKALQEFASLDPEAAKVLRAMHAKVVAMEKQLGNTEQAVQERAIAEAQRESKRLRGEALGAYPEVKGDVAWSSVLTAAQRIAEEKDLDDAQTAVTQALKEIYGARKPAKEPVKADRIGDTPESPGRKSNKPPASKEERALAAFDVITSPAGNRDEARKVFHG